MATTTTNQGLPYPEDADDPNPPLHIKQLAEAVEKKLVQVFQSVADRNVKLTTPADGMFCILKDEEAIEFHDGEGWTRIWPLAIPAITSGTAVPANGSGVNGDVFLKVV